MSNRSNETTEQRDDRERSIAYQVRQAEKAGADAHTIRRIERGETTWIGSGDVANIDLG